MLRLLSILIGIVVLMTACSPTGDSAGQDGGTVQDNTVLEYLAPADFRDKLGLEGVQLVDVRTPDEWAETGTLSGAARINYRDADFAAQIADLNKDRPVMVYCHSGGRSKKACKIFKEAGFKEIYELDSGISGWMSAGLPVEK